MLSTDVKPTQTIPKPEKSIHFSSVAYMSLLNAVFRIFGETSVFASQTVVQGTKILIHAAFAYNTKIAEEYADVPQILHLLSLFLSDAMVITVFDGFEKSLRGECFSAIGPLVSFIFHSISYAMTNVYIFREIWTFINFGFCIMIMIDTRVLRYLKPIVNRVYDKMFPLPEHHLLGMGNPLLDIQTTVEKSFLDKWGLKENDAILCDDKHNDMFTELTKDPTVQYIPGGAAQNSLRVAQWILNSPNRTVFFGAVGKDQYGELLATKAKEAGVNVQYQVNETVKTGTCAVLNNEPLQSLCAHLAAANTFTQDHLQKEENQKIIEQAKYFYVTGFFITVCPPAIIQLATHSAAFKKTFILNLSAPFISQFFFDELSKIIPLVDVLFGNEDEAAAFAKAHGWETTCVKEIARKAADLPRKKVLHCRLVVFMRKTETVVVAYGSKVTEYPVTRLPKAEIVDTTGSEDAFVGGFLSQFIQGKGIEASVACGSYAAQEVTKRYGCTVPSVCKYH
ncbi:unnamed protein product [Caenorhabditis nigoni]